MYLWGTFYPPHWLALFLQIALNKKKTCPTLKCQHRFNYCYYDEVWSATAISMLSPPVWCPFLFQSEVVMKSIICNHGNNSAVMPLKRAAALQVFWSLINVCAVVTGTDSVCGDTFFLENYLRLTGIYLSYEERGTSSDFLLKSNVASLVSREARYVVIMR